MVKYLHIGLSCYQKKINKMKNYFYTDGVNNFGPFSLEELKEKNISRETLVWFQELKEWKPAGSVIELSEIFKLAPPPIKNTNSTNTKTENIKTQQPPKTWLLESILVTLFCCLPLGIVGIVNSSKVESKFYSGDIEGANKLSTEAKKWITIGFFISLAGIVIYLLICLIIIVLNEH
jgi:hypothetical protein